MKTTTRIWLVIGAFLLLAGSVLFVSVLAANGWDFSALGTYGYETNIHEVKNTFENISIETDTADIVFVPSADGTCRVECAEETNATHDVTVENGTLIIKLVNNKAWYDYIGFGFGSAKISVFLPEAFYSTLTVRESTGDIEIPHDFTFERIDVSVSTGDIVCRASTAGNIKIETSTGSIAVENLSAKTLNLSVSTGKLTVSDVMCNKLISNGSTGDMLLQNVVAAESFLLERSTGDIRFERSDAAKIEVHTDTGDVTGSLLTAKKFVTETDTGRVNVPQTSDGGKCEITTDTGDIRITVAE